MAAWITAATPAAGHEELNLVGGSSADGRTRRSFDACPSL